MLFPETNLSFLTHDSIQALEVKNSILFNFVSANSFILSCFFIFFWTVGLYFLISVVIAYIFNHTPELTIATGIPTNEAKCRNQNTTTDSKNKNKTMLKVIQSRK